MKTTCAVATIAACAVATSAKKLRGLAASEKPEFGNITLPKWEDLPTTGTFAPNFSFPFAGMGLGGPDKNVTEGEFPNGLVDWETIEFELREPKMNLRNYSTGELPYYTGLMNLSEPVAFPIAAPNFSFPMTGTLNPMTGTLNPFEGMGMGGPDKNSTEGELPNGLVDWGMIEFELSEPKMNLPNYSTGVRPVYTGLINLSEPVAFPLAAPNFSFPMTGTLNPFEGMGLGGPDKNSTEGEFPNGLVDPETIEFEVTKDKMNLRNYSTGEPPVFPIENSSVFSSDVGLGSLWRGTWGGKNSSWTGAMGWYDHRNMTDFCDHCWWGFSTACNECATYYGSSR